MVGTLPRSAPERTPCLGGTSSGPGGLEGPACAGQGACFRVCPASGRSGGPSRARTRTGSQRLSSPWTLPWILPLGSMKYIINISFVQELVSALDLGAPGHFPFHGRGQGDSHHGQGEDDEPHPAEGVIPVSLMGTWMSMGKHQHLLPVTIRDQGRQGQRRHASHPYP